MEIIVKGEPRRLEFGAPGNFGTLTPESVSLVSYNKQTPIYAVINYDYGDGRTIDLCHDEINEIDFESFGTTFEKELEAIGYTTSNVKFRKNGLLYIVDENDPDEYLVTYDSKAPFDSRVYKGRYECSAHSPEEALELAKKNSGNPSWMSNITVTKY